MNVAKYIQNKYIFFKMFVIVGWSKILQHNIAYLVSYVLYVNLVF